MDILQTIFFTLIALGVLVSFHEYGHFWVARRCGVKVQRFSIGFGTPLLRWRDAQDTEFVIAALPLGGYVKMVDEREGNVAEEDLPYAFSRKTVWQRIAIVAAGPAANFLLAIVAFWIVFLSGERGLAPVAGDIKPNSLAAESGFESGTEIIAVDGVPTATWSAATRQLFGFIGTSGDIPFTVTYPDSTIQYQLLVPVDKWLRDAEEPSPLRELGIQPAFELESLYLVAVSEDGAGYSAGLRAEDRLLAINNIDITSIGIFIDTIADSAGRNVELLVERDGGEQLVIPVTPRLVDRDGQQVGQLGVQLSSVGRYPEELLRSIDHNPLSALFRASSETLDTSFFVLESIGKLVVGELSPKNLSGPITIAKVAGDTAKSGFDNFIRFIAILSIMLGVMNLLPIPVLDGGHLVYYLIEIVKGSPVSDAVQLVGYKVGFFMLMGLMVFATYNDVMRSF
ncbi:MAG: RIP metalloprotease RseP [Porticoccaceae bacterium]|nr:RIP metalloprotease RseP [Porticoccaceae bacterium]